MTEVRLLRCIRDGRAPHAVLLSGPEGSGKALLARRAAALYCLGADTPDALASCPNYTELSGRAVGIDDVRALVGSAGMQSFNGGNRAFVILDAHRMSEQSQNALLKTLEEPPKNLLLLLTGSEAGLLPTIRSRCMTERLGALPEAALCALLAAAGVSEKDAALAARLSCGVPGEAKYYASAEGAAFREAALDALQEALYGTPPFDKTASLIKGAGTTEADASGKKSRSDPDKALRLLSLWEGMARDALVCRIGCGDVRNTDRVQQLDRMAFRFTESEIQSIIEMLTTARQRVYQRANPQFALDAVIAGLLTIKE